MSKIRLDANNTPYLYRFDNVYRPPNGATQHKVGAIVGVREIKGSKNIIAKKQGLREEWICCGEYKTSGRPTEELRL